MSLVAKDPVASEAGHWYTINGTPMYTVLSSKGVERNTTLRDARALNLVPSVTTILNVAAKPGLIRWLQQQVLLAALTLPKQDNEPEEEYIDRILKDSKEEGKAAADAGTDIHAVLQNYYEKPNDPCPMPELAMGFESTLNEHFGEQEWICERSFAHSSGFGGKVDMHSKGGNIVVDIKTKNFTDPKQVAGYDEHLMQLAAYRVGLGMQTARCANVFVSRNMVGLYAVKEWTDEELRKGWKMFYNLLQFWQVKNNYEPKL